SSPLHLPVLPSFPTRRSSDLALLLVVITILAVATIRRAPYLAVGWFWYLGTLVPVIGLVQVGRQAMADRYSYIPQIGLCIAAARSEEHTSELQSRSDLVCRLL